MVAVTLPSIGAPSNGVFFDRESDPGSTETATPPPPRRPPHSPHMPDAQRARPLQLHNLRRTSRHQPQHLRRRHAVLAMQHPQRQPQRGLKPGDAVGSALEFDLFFVPRMRAHGRSQCSRRSHPAGRQSQPGDRSPSAAADSSWRWYRSRRSPASVSVK